VSRPTRVSDELYLYGAVTRFGPTFQMVPVRFVGALA
jgi:hypothetical protein